MTSTGDAVDQLRADYDATPYTSNSFPQSAPGQLAAIAHLFGLDTPAVPTARVLEIGCAAGGNIIPFAAAQPRAHVVGVDLSQVQIDEGRVRAQALGLDNLQLIAGDIATINLTGLGQFDFIIAHGVYSWVPPETQEALLAGIRACLAPDGVAYVSYNVYPGWKSKEVLRDAMLLASGASTTPGEKIRDARGMLDFLEEVAPSDGVMARVIAECKASSEGFGDSYLLHDELETFNSPCYFYEMVGRAGAHGLAYLAEARPETMLPGYYGPTVAEYVSAKSSGVQVLVDQYLDFVTNRMFRESLLVHAQRAPQVRYVPALSRYHGLHVAAWLPPVDGPTVLDNSRQEYLQSDGATLFTNDLGIKATLDVLNARWPWTLSRAELVTAVHDRIRSAGFSPGDNLPDVIDSLVGTLIMQGQLRYRLEPVALEPVDPVPLRIDETARRMAESTSGRSAAATFNRWHETLELSPLDSRLLPLLDGTRDNDALVDALSVSLRAHPLEIELAGRPVAGEAELRAVLAEYVETMPARLTEMKLLRVR
ncbi:class I SAM-dependent methyltransferase [Mycolicibacterium komossense]|uniref:Methyltransferase regulatory domain-containing protein n=1 Tax=Mycolicibacterium komossense TaxID=1779 RepID=A0ABT3CAS8_9MYCO|nr:class I SAM-dependent methyltransferase [Mycolicibacterium komossense]MCV7226558.1 methyltransferase regulatory domain-containing protein [Mycolicibacterium komossense]